MLSQNEWDPLKTVIVGIAANAKVPVTDLSMRTVNYAGEKEGTVFPEGPYPQQVIDEATEDLEVFSDFLKSVGVTVLRPNDTNPPYYNYCPRDSVLVYKDLIIATPQPLRPRYREFQAFAHHLTPYGKITDLSAEHPDLLYNLACVGNPDIFALTEIAPAFDAANILRANDDLIYLVSNGGNRSGAALLQDVIGNRGKVWTLEGVYSFMHIDSTIALLREGLMLLNPDRIKCKSQLPPPLRPWDAIWCPEPFELPVWSGYTGASKWMNMNLFSVNPELVVLEERQDSLRLALEKYNIECAMLPCRHQRTLSGGFHCVTLDIERSLND